MWAAPEAQLPAPRPAPGCPAASGLGLEGAAGARLRPGADGALGAALSTSPTVLRAAVGLCRPSGPLQPAPLFLSLGLRGHRRGKLPGLPSEGTWNQPERE